MQRLLAAVFTLSVAGMPAVAADFLLDPAASHVGFRAVVENAEFKGSFSKFDARATFDPVAPGRGRIVAKVGTGSVDSQNGQRDELLVAADWFNVTKWPQARFETTTIARTAQGFRAQGRLTLRDVTRPAVMEMTWTPEPGNAAARLQGTVRLKRLDFGVGQGEWKDTNYVADGVTVDVDVRFVLAATRQQPAGLSTGPGTTR